MNATTVIRPTTPEAVQRNAEANFIRTVCAALQKQKQKQEAKSPPCQNRVGAGNRYDLPK